MSNNIFSLDTKPKQGVVEPGENFGEGPAKAAIKQGRGEIEESVRADAQQGPKGWAQEVLNAIPTTVGQLTSATGQNVVITVTDVTGMESNNSASLPATMGNEALGPETNVSGNTVSQDAAASNSGTLNPTMSNVPLNQGNNCFKAKI